MKSIPCGYYELPADEVFHYAGYETAAWWTRTLVKAGRYEVVAYVENGHVREFSAKLTGTVQSDNFQSLYFGSPIGKPYDETKNAGKPSDHYLRIYSYDAPREKSGRWHIDYSVLPNVGRCVHCGTVTFGSDHAGSAMCVTCSVNVRRGDEFMVTSRYPRMLKTLSCDGEFGSIASSTLADAKYNRSEYHRKSVSRILRMVRQARRQFGRPEKNWFKVYSDGRVYSDGNFLGRVTA